MIESAKWVKAPLGRRKLWRLAYHRLHKLGLIPAAFLVDHPAVTGLWDEKRKERYRQYGCNVQNLDTIANGDFVKFILVFSIFRLIDFIFPLSLSIPKSSSSS